MSARWSPFIKQVVMVGILIAAVWFFLNMHLLLTPVILALLLAYLVSFPVGWILRNTGWPRTAVVASTYLFVLIVVVTAPFLVIPRLISLVTAFGTTLANVLEELAGATPKPIVIGPSLQVDLGSLYEPISQWLRAVLLMDVGQIPNVENLLFPFASSAALVVRSAVSSVLWIIFVLVTSFYIARDGPAMGRWIMARVPESIRPEVKRLWREVALTWDAFVRGQITLSIIIGVIVWLTMAILGLRSAPALGLLSGLAEFVPGVGPVVAAIVGVLIALILGSSWLSIPPIWFAVVVAALYTLIQQVENLYLLPRVVGRRIALHPVVVIVGALAGAQLGGVLGLLLAAPVIASLRTLFGYVFHKLLDEEPFPPVEPPPDRSILWQGLVREHPICAVVFDLDGTLLEIDDFAIERLAHILSPIRQLLPNVNLVLIARRLLLYGNFFANQLIMLLRLLRLNRWVVKLDDWVRQIRGIRDPSEFRVIPGSMEMLRWLGKRYRLGIVSSRPRREVTAFLTFYGLNGVFRAIVTRDDAPRLKPHPMPMQLIAKRLGTKPDECVMVGDTSMDVRAAKGAGMLCIAVLSGFGEESDLQGADLIINSTAQLGGWL